MTPTNDEPPSISPCCQLFLPTYLTSTLRVSSNGWDNTTCVDLSSISSRHVIQRSFRGCLGDWFFSWLSCVCALVFMNTVASLFSALEPSPEDTHDGGCWNTELRRRLRDSCNEDFVGTKYNQSLTLGA
jgi:hypothetical protein